MPRNIVIHPSREAFVASLRYIERPVTPSSSSDSGRVLKRGGKQENGHGHYAGFTRRADERDARVLRSRFLSNKKSSRTATSSRRRTAALVCRETSSESPIMNRFSRVVCAAALCLPLAVPGAAERPRLAVLTDIGADPDDQQSMIRLMVYANEFDLELLIATGAGTPGELKEAITRPDLIRQIVDAYGEVLPNLQRHAAGWPTAESLHARVMSGNPLRGRQYVGAGHDTAASRALIDRIDAGTPDRR